MEYDCIIILGNLMDSQGRLNDESASRVTAGAQAYKAGKSSLLVTCGWAYRSDSSITIADAMFRYAHETHGIPTKDILKEENSRDTVGDAYFTRRNLADPRNFSQILVVTSSYHAERTKKIFEFIYGPNFVIDLISAPSCESIELQNSEQESLTAFQKTFAGVAPGDKNGILQSLREKHPFYNGVAYPII